MSSLQILESLRKANDDISIASKELTRPKENVMTLCACQCTRRGVIQFLRAYLSGNGNDNITHSTMENLFKECCRTDKHFCSVDISCFLCQTIQEDCVGGYCLDIGKVNQCFQTAGVIKELVCAKLKINPAQL